MFVDPYEKLASIKRDVESLELADYFESIDDRCALLTRIEFNLKHMQRDAELGEHDERED